MPDYLENKSLVDFADLLNYVRGDERGALLLSSIAISLKRIADAINGEQNCKEFLNKIYGKFAEVAAVPLPWVVYSHSTASNSSRIIARFLFKELAEYYVKNAPEINFHSYQIFEEK